VIPAAPNLLLARHPGHAVIHGRNAKEHDCRDGVERDSKPQGFPAENKENQRSDDDYRGGTQVEPTT